jgi:hypothetical protein
VPGAPLLLKSSICGPSGAGLFSSAGEQGRVLRLGSAYGRQDGDEGPLRVQQICRRCRWNLYELWGFTLHLRPFWPILLMIAFPPDGIGKSITVSDTAAVAAVREAAGVKKPQGGFALPGPAEDRPKGRSSRLPWAALLARVFQVDVFSCPRCFARMSRIAWIVDRQVVRKILRAVGLATDSPGFHPSHSLESPFPDWRTA